MSREEITVPQSLDGVRVDRAVALLTDSSRSSVDRLLEAGSVHVNGTPARSRRQVLRIGDRLVIDGSPVAGLPLLEADESVEFAVVHADPQVIVVDKPAGLVVHPGAGHRSGTLANGLIARFPELAAVAVDVDGDTDRPGIVHRLDRGTSGLLVVARTTAAYYSLVAQLTDRSVARRYRALVHGTVDGESGLVDAPIGRSVQAPTRMAITRKGKEARTRYEVADRFDFPAPATLIDVSLETGRTHQIRVHLAAIGHPVVGDDVYGRGRQWEGSTIVRPFLHAHRLSFDHPATGERVEWSSPLPPDLAGELNRLRP